MAEEHPFNEAGRRIKAALMSYLLRRAGVDRTLKELPDDPGEGWAELAEVLLREMQGGVISAVLGAKPPRREPIQ